jgi:hypothetical protein
MKSGGHPALHIKCGLHKKPSGCPKKTGLVVVLEHRFDARPGGDRRSALGADVMNVRVNPALDGVARQTLLNEHAGG